MINLGENLAYSETHIFNPSLIDELRFGFNYGNFSYLQPNNASNLSPTLGLGGVPFSASLDTGGLPSFTVSGLSNFGTTAYFPTKEGENVYQFLDNLTKDIGNHSLKFGISIQSIRFRTLQVSQPLGAYSFTGQFTSDLNAANTGYGVADFLTDEMYSASVSTLSQFDDVRWYRAAYVQDDWRVTPALTLNLGLRYDYAQPIRENSNGQANFLPFPTGPGAGSGSYIIPAQNRQIPLSTAFVTLLAKDNIILSYSANPFLVQPQKTNFAPRFGFAYTANPRTALRGGYGIFFGGLENRGGATNLGDNYPFQYTSSFPSPNCRAGNCSSDG